MPLSPTQMGFVMRNLGAFAAKLKMSPARLRSVLASYSPAMRSMATGTAQRARSIGATALQGARSIGVRAPGPASFVAGGGTSTQRFLNRGLNMARRGRTNALRANAYKRRPGWPLGPVTMGGIAGTSLLAGGAAWGTSRNK